LLKYSFNEPALLSEVDTVRDDRFTGGEGEVSSKERIAGLTLSVDELDIRVSRFKKEKGMLQGIVVVSNPLRLLVPLIPVQFVQE